MTPITLALGGFQLHLREVQKARVVGRGNLWEGGHQYISNFTVVDDTY